MDHQHPLVGLKGSLPDEPRDLAITPSPNDGVSFIQSDDPGFESFVGHFGFDVLPRVNFN